MSIKLYSIGCPRCEVLKEKLEQSSISFEVMDDVNVIASLGIGEVPMLEVDGKLMGFKEAVDWIKAR